MRPKRRAVVTVAPTGKGMLFRLGEQFLEITGETSWPRFQQVAPFLNGDTSLEQARARLAADHYAFLARIVDALVRAGMVYDAAEDASDDAPGTRDARQAGTLRRFEAHGAQPLRTFARARRSRIIIAGDPHGVGPLLEGCAEAGMTPSAIYVPCATGADAALPARDLARRVRAEWDTSVEILPAPAFREIVLSRDPGDVLLFAASTDTDAELRSLRSAAADRGSPLFTLDVYDDAVVAATLMAGVATGCHECLDACYGCAAPAASPAPETVARGVRIAARLLVQQMLDCHAGVWPMPQAADLSELDLHTFEIRHRRLFPHQDCRRCAAPASSIASAVARRDSPDVEAASPPARDAVRLWPQADAFYCDSRTGFITDRSEGRLLQFPWHQSAVRRRASAGSPPRWITDAGQDIYEARLAALLRAVEASLVERLVNPAGASDLESSRVVASGWTADEAQGAALLQAAAQLAQAALPDWSDVTTADLLFHAAKDLTLDYFCDVGLLPRIRVQRHVPLSHHGLHVLRFAWDSRVIAVAAGLEHGPIMQAGLRDLWLDRTGLEFFGNAWTGTPIRFRSCGRAPLVSVLRDSLEAAGLAPRLQLVDSPLTRGVAPMRFAHAALARTRPGRASAARRAMEPA